MDAANGVVISPDGKKVYVINELYSGGPFFTSQLSIVDTATDAIIGTIAIPAGAAAGISITPDGEALRREHGREQRYRRRYRDECGDGRYPGRRVPHQPRQLHPAGT